MSTATATNGSNGNRIATIPAPATSTTDETRSISPFASEVNFVAAQRVATALGQSSLVPKQYQGRENMPNVLIALELASRIGASPLMVMQNLYIVQGKPSWSSSFLIACVNQSQRFTPLRFRWEGKPGADDWGCRAVAKDKDTGEECVGSLITIKLAKAEGWFGKSGSKWQTMPEQMLTYRAAGFWSRVYAPELSLGMLTREEAVDIQSEGPQIPNATADLDAEILAEVKPVPAPVETNNATFAPDGTEPAKEVVTPVVADEKKQPPTDPDFDPEATAQSLIERAKAAKSPTKLEDVYGAWMKVRDQMTDRQKADVKAAIDEAKKAFAAK